LFVCIKQIKYILILGHVRPQPMLRRLDYTIHLTSL